jgi:hypothetical protein
MFGLKYHALEEMDEQRYQLVSPQQVARHIKRIQERRLAVTLSRHLGQRVHLPDKKKSRNTQATHKEHMKPN